MAAKTYWCTECNRFMVSVDGTIPKCPRHGTEMVPDPKDPRRVQSNAPVDDPSRKPNFSRVYDAEQLEIMTRCLEDIKSAIPIPLISNAEDEDLKNEAMMGLILRKQAVAISIPEPRHTWQGKLDPAWVEKFQPLLEGCEITIYARRKGTKPNPATQYELNVLKDHHKTVIVYELDGNERRAFKDEL